MFSKRIIWFVFFVMGKLSVKSNYLDTEHEKFDTTHDDDNLIIDGSYLAEFINDYDLVPQANPFMQRITPDNTFSHGDTVYELDKKQPFNVFTSDARYLHDGVPRKPSETNLFRLETDEDIVIVKHDDANEMKTIYIVNKRFGEAVESHSLYSGIFATIRFEDYDKSTSFYETETIANLESPNNIFERKDVFQNEQRQPCVEHRQLDVAVTYDSSFCSRFGQGDWTIANREVEALIAMTSARFEQDRVCMRLKISHLEGHCDPETDPYKEVFDRPNDTNGCDNELGILNTFMDNWNNKEEVIERDTALFLTISEFGCNSKFCQAGCGTQGSICDLSRAYSVATAQTSNVNFRTTIIAHEIGHNSDGDHHYEVGYIMHPVANEARFGFYASTITKFNEYFRKANCFEWVAVTESPSIAPSSAPSTPRTIIEDIIDGFIRFFFQYTTSDIYFDLLFGSMGFVVLLTICIQLY